VDRGANGGIAGSDTRVIFRHLRKVDVTGIDNHEMTDLSIVDAAGWAMSNEGPVILILRQYAYHGMGRTIHSALQLEQYKIKVDDRSIKAGGRQCITTLEGLTLPLDIINGLPYLKIRPPSDDELRDLPHVIMTSGDKWNPALLDCTLSDKEDWYNTICRLNEGTLKTPFDEYGRYRGREPVIGISEPPQSVVEDESSSSSDESIEEHEQIDDDADSIDDLDYEVIEPEYRGALHEITAAFHTVYDLNNCFSTFRVTTRSKAKKDQQITSPDETHPQEDQVNPKAGTTEEKNDSTRPTNPTATVNAIGEDTVNIAPTEVDENV
jgi:hypothetical protein